MTNGSRAKARKLINMRARKLLSKVFYQGFYINRRESQLSKKLNKAAAFFFIRSYLNKGVDAMRANVKLQHKRRIIQEKRNFMLLKTHLRPWSHLALDLLKAKDFR